MSKAGGSCLQTGAENLWCHLLSTAWHMPLIIRDSFRLYLPSSLIPAQTVEPAEPWAVKAQGSQTDPLTPSPPWLPVEPSPWAGSPAPTWAGGRKLGQGTRSTPVHPGPWQAHGSPPVLGSRELWNYKGSLMGMLIL